MPPSPASSVDGHPRGRTDDALHVFMTADAVGGVFQYARDLAGGLATRGVRTTLALLGPAPTAAQQAWATGVPGLTLISSGLPLDWLADDAGKVRQAAEAMAELALQHRADIVHLNSPALAAAPYAVPVVAVLHSCLASWWRAVKGGPMPADFGWRTEATARGLDAADLVVCPSAAFARQAHEIYGIQPLVVHNGRASPPPAAPAVASPFVFTSGRLWDEGKNISTLAAASRLTTLPVLAAGSLTGPHGARAVVGDVQSLGLLDDADVSTYLARQPIFVSAALYEPFGLGVLEAAQAGCPLVLADIPTFRELWQDAALFASPRDATAVADAVNRLARDHDLRTERGAAARKRAGRYTVPAMATRMLAVYAAAGAPAALSHKDIAA